MSIQYLNFFIIKKYSDALTHRFLYNLGKLANRLSQSKSFLSQFFFFFHIKREELPEMFIFLYLNVDYLKASKVAWKILM